MFSNRQCRPWAEFLTLCFAFGLWPNVTSILGSTAERERHQIFDRIIPPLLVRDALRAEHGDAEAAPSVVIG
jgi:hypothetical protein